LPARETTKQSRSVFDTLAFHFDHRTGGRMFVWSRAVGNY
jgi:hypothetical protein